MYYYLCNHILFLGLFLTTKGNLAIIGIAYLYIGYHTRAIITRGLYIFYPIFVGHLFVFKEVFSENYVLMYG